MFDHRTSMCGNFDEKLLAIPNCDTNSSILANLWVEIFWLSKSKVRELNGKVLNLASHGQNDPQTYLNVLSNQTKANWVLRIP